MNAIESSGKTVQDAVSKALQESGWSLGEIEWEVVQEESKGLLGIGAKPAIVRVTLLSDEKEQQAPKPGAGAPRQTPRREAPRKETAPDGQHRAEKPRPQKREQPKTELSEMQGEPVDPETHPAGQFLSKLLMLMDVEPSLRMFKAEDALYIDVLSEKMSALIGQRGETLDAVQYLTALVINKGENEYTRVMLDTQNYRKKRETTLQNLARRLAARARQSGRRVVLEPMNPYERRVMHATLQNSPHVKTHSEGVEPNRRVVIEPISGERKDAR